ncbi:hypothetical protein KVR01_012732 [Diaporthe batatas]|uniref:uncharacterized protein n=1 Tax=Diaporthe batatas TaxID=748121 RepID=UPI001D059402|nr:uncharacterized protein KVR01_012732 [Diaporthe batatas]KAG8157348.1 hypothetical protein KVR01_012732 [Diaporthe batatas]
MPRSSSIESNHSASLELPELAAAATDLQSLLGDDVEEQRRSRSYIICLVLGMAGWSDACGRRKPFIVAGSLAIVVALLGYAWSPDLVALLPGARGGKSSSAVLSQVSVSFFFLLLNIAIQPVQSGLRALVVDKCTASQQAQATAWASRISFVASMASYFAAASDLAGEFPVRTNQLQSLVNLSIIVIVSSTGVTCCVVSEGREKRPAPPEVREGLLDTWKMLSPHLRRIYVAQFFSWFAWFPVLVQTTG